MRKAMPAEGYEPHTTRPASQSWFGVIDDSVVPASGGQVKSFVDPMHCTSGSFDSVVNGVSDGAFFGDDDDEVAVGTW